MKSFETIKKNNDFKRVYKKGASKVGSYLVIYTLANHCKKNKIGITVSKKLGNAVKRNRARRVIKEAYRLNKDKFKAGYDIVFVLRGRCVKASMPEVEKCLIRLMSAHDMIKTNGEAIK